jgi:hypothetical protein
MRLSSRLSKCPALPITTEAEGLAGARPELLEVVVPQDEIRRGVDDVGARSRPTEREARRGSVAVRACATPTGELARQGAILDSRRYTPNIRSLAM